MKIIPAIYPEIFEEIADKLYLLMDITKSVQIVICDGSYGLRKSWDPTGKEILPAMFHYEFDCIVVSWRDYIAKAHYMGAESIIVHVDEFTDKDFEDLFVLVHRYGFALGLTISNDVSVNVIIDALHKMENSRTIINPEKIFLQVTGLRNVSEDKHAFDERVLSRIRALKKLLPTLPLQVSGRINLETVGAIKEAGADRLVVSSYIFGHENLREAIDNLMKAGVMEKVIPEPELESEPEIEEKKPEIVELAKPIESEIVQGEKIEEDFVAKERRKRRVNGLNYKASTEEIVYDVEDDFFLRKQEEEDQQVIPQ